MDGSSGRSAQSVNDVSSNIDKAIRCRCLSLG